MILTSDYLFQQQTSCKTQSVRRLYTTFPIYIKRNTVSFYCSWSVPQYCIGVNFFLLCLNLVCIKIFLAAIFVPDFLDSTIIFIYLYMYVCVCMYVCMSFMNVFMYCRCRLKNNSVLGTNTSSYVMCVCHVAHTHMQDEHRPIGRGLYYFKICCNFI